MKLLLTNDDGIDAPGLQALAEAARPMGELVIVAPADPLSGCSHQVTTGSPLRVEERRPGWFAVSGTPADCVRVALLHIAPKTTWVLSGINAGGNLGADVHYSGTVAAVREAILHGWPGVALSQYRKRGLVADWHRASVWATSVLRNLLARPRERGTFWNVNLPHLTADDPDPEIIVCRLDPTPLPLSYRHEEDGSLHYDGDYHQRQREPGCDVDVCFGGKIAATLIRLL